MYTINILYYIESNFDNVKYNEIFISHEFIKRIYKVYILLNNRTIINYI